MEVTGLQDASGPTVVVKLPAAAQSAALQPPPPPPPPPPSLSYTSLGLAWRGFHPSSQSVAPLTANEIFLYFYKHKHNACVASSRKDSFYPQLECYVTTLRLSLLGDIIGGEIIDARYNLPS